MSAPCGFLRLSEKKTKLKGRTFSSLIYARAVHLCSKYKTFHEVLPNLYDPVHFSDDQLLDGLAFLENDYEKFVEIFTVQTDYVFGLDTSKTCFDGTNFYKEYITYAKFNPHCTYKEYMNSNSSTARFKKAFESMFEDISYLGKDPRKGEETIYFVKGDRQILFLYISEMQLIIQMRFVYTVIMIWKYRYDFCGKYISDYVHSEPVMHFKSG